MQSIHANGANPVWISGSRFEPSPYLECYDNPEMINGVYAGRFYPTSNGDDPIAMYWALRRKAVLYDVPERPVEITGPDVVAFLERIFARRISDLNTGRGRYAIACTPKGGIFMDGILFRLDENRFWYVQPDGALEAWLAAHSEGFDIEVSDPRSRVLQIQGPRSLDVMQRASDGAIDQGMGYFHSGYYSLGGQQLYVSRTGWTGELGYEIYSLGDKTDHPRLWNHLMEIGAPDEMTFSSLSSMEIRRIEAGILDNLTDMDMSMTPFQAGLEAFIDLDKPEFVGRAALQNADRRKLLFGVKCKDAALGMGDLVLKGDEPCGRITAGCHSPFLECGIGYVRFANPGEWVGEKLIVKLQSGGEHECEIVELPFHDPQKLIARGIGKSVP
jgi:aminomethyltransferase